MVWKKRIWINCDSCCWIRSSGWAWYEAEYDCQVENGRVRFKGDVRAIIKNVIFGCGLQTNQIVIGSFLPYLWRLFQGVFALDWVQYLPLGYVSPSPKQNVKSKLHNEPVYKRFQKAVVKSCQNTMPARKAFHWLNGPEFKIEVSIWRTKRLF